MKVQRLNGNNIEAAKNFMFKIIKDEFNYDYNPLWHGDIVDLENTYLKRSRSAFFALVEDGQIRGTIGGRFYDKDYPEFRDRYTSKNTIGVWRHYIHKSMRGKGLGTRLLKRLEAFAKQNNYKYIYLHTQKSIPGSLEYWLSRGYEITFDTKDKFQTVHLEKKIFDTI